VTRDTAPTLAAITRFFPPKLLHWVGPPFLLGVIALVMAIVVASTGLLAFPASLQDPEGLTQLIHGSFRRMVDQHSDDTVVPLNIDAAWRVQIGAAHFAHTCATCHGEPDRGQNPTVLSMRPRPQYLPAVVDEFTPKELFWIVKHGVKFSGMPAWPHQQRDDEVWNVVAFLRHMKGMTGATYANLAYGREAAAKISPQGVQYAFTENNASEYPRDEHSYTWPASSMRSNPAGSDSCDACHGDGGAGRPGGMAPNLTIQTAEYLSAALRSFATGARPSGIMQTVAASMSPVEQDSAAKYFGGKSQPGPGKPPPTPAATEQLGQAIAIQGIPARRIAACTSCHGVEGASKVGFPVIAGQNPLYLAEQMKLFRQGGRGRTEGYNPMNAEAHKLTDAEIASVARYYSMLPPGKSPLATTASATVH
jgi:cytochrome c553